MNKYNIGDKVSVPEEYIQNAIITSVERADSNPKGGRYSQLDDFLSDLDTYQYTIAYADDDIGVVTNTFYESYLHYGVQDGVQDDA